MAKQRTDKGTAKGGSSKTSSWSFSSLGTAVALIVAVVVGVTHFVENYAYIRHLLRIHDKGLAQAAALQTENAFYYSYYSELVEAESVVAGLERIIWDRRSEYPDVLNAIRRFNIYQEVVLALEYRVLRAFGFNFLDAWDFFRYHILGLNGVGHAALALLASEISGNPLAGGACFIISFLNRFQISRLGNFSTSNLREIWAIPILWMQVLCLWRLLTSPASQRSKKLWFGFGSLTFIFIVMWQFSPFLLLLQAAALYFVYLVCGYRQLRPVMVGVINVYLVAMALAVGVHFGSPYLVTSLFAFELVGLKIATSIFACPRRASWQQTGSMRACRWALWRLADVVEGLFALVIFALVRKAMEPLATADTHVYDILCTKPSAVNDLLPKEWQLDKSRMPDCAEPSFNARLYLIMGVFNLLEKQSLQIYWDTGAGQTAALSCLLVALRFISSSLCGSCSTSPTDQVQKAPSSGKKAADPKSKENVVPSNGTATKPEGENWNADHAEEAALVFFVVQFLLFFLIGCLINRLRVAFGPPMMVLAVCCFGPRLFPWRQLLNGVTKWAVLSVLAALFFGHCAWMLTLFPCVKDNDGVCQHLSDKHSSDGDMADLCDWINNDLDINTPLLTSMNLAGSLRLFTGVPLVIHPQFESENLRKRVQMGYELYHCGSEESFEQTMHKLQAEVVIFEYARCFFTPYILDDRRKNCQKNKHKPEQQLCLKLHANSPRFELIFTNGGYAVFRLRKTPLPDGDSEMSPPAIAAQIASPDNWRSFIDECTRTQKHLCGPRILETAATWEHGMKRKNVASTLRRLADKAFPEDGYVNYYLARYYDYDANEIQKAHPYYKKAIKKLPNNPLILKEYIMFLDMGLKDSSASSKLIKDRSKDKGDVKGFMNMEGAGVGALLCEAAIDAKDTKGLESFGHAMWAKALHLAPLSSCVENNWQLYYGEPNTYKQTHTVWDKVRMLYNGGVQHEVGSHHQPAVRFLGDRPFLLLPPKVFLGNNGTSDNTGTQRAHLQQDGEL